MNIAGKRLTAVLLPLLVVTMVVNLASCGTILYPERHNQPAGKIDVGVAFLDGIGLLFFIIPGVIAFAVDFSNHSIYLPHSRSSRLDGGHNYSALHFDGKPDMATIENMVRAETGKTIDLRQASVQVVRLDSAAGLDARFALYDAGNRVALAQ